MGVGSKLARGIVISSIALGGAHGCASEPGPAPSVRRSTDSRYGLVYEFDRYLPGLDAMVHVVKTPQHAFAILPDGRRVGLAQLRKMNRDAYRSRYGALPRKLHDELRAADPASRHRTVAYFDISEVGHDVLDALFSTDTVASASARLELGRFIEERGAALPGELSLRGGSVSKVGSKIPAIFSETTAEELLELAADRRILRIGLVEGLEAEERQEQCNGYGDKPDNFECDHDPNVIHGIDDTFNANGYYGEGQKVAIYEPGAHNRKLEEGHEAFTLIDGFYYMNENASGGVSDHGSRVASVVSGAYFLTCGANFVSLYFPNEGDTTYWPGAGTPIGTRMTCGPLPTVATYEWIVEAGDYFDPLEDPPMAAVNESWGCLPDTVSGCDYEAIAETYKMEGVTQDYFARFYDMVVVKAAGNDNCDPDDEACPFTLNSVCVGNAYHDASAMACNSADENPGESTANTTFAQDREEPDVTAFGGVLALGQCSEASTCVADVGTRSDWKAGFGTSFAAPVITSMVALFREACEPNYERRITQREMRMLIRHAAVGGNPSDTAYSTPRPTLDQKDGGGFLMAADLMAHCEPPTEGGDMSWNLDGGEEGSPPDGDAPYQSGWDPAGETQSFTQPLDFNYTPPASREWAYLIESWDLDEGDRIRATLVWDACAVDDTGEAPLSVSVDFDLFLLRNGEDPEYVWASQSADDNTEGFDYTVGEGEDGTYSLIMMWPTGSENCEGGSNVPIAWIASQYSSQ